MMKNKKNKIVLLIVSIAAVVLIGVMLLLIFLPKGGDDSGTGATIDEGTPLTTDVDNSGMHQAEVVVNSKGEIDNNSYGTLVKYDTAKVIELEVENSKGSMKITSETPTNTDGETEATIYTIEGYEDFELQSGMADQIANAAAQIEFSKVISVDGKDDDKYGFDKPMATVRITYDDDTTAVVTVGSYAPQEIGAYIKFGSSNTIYFTDVDSVSAFSYGLTDMFSLAINDAPETSDNNYVKSVTLGGSRLKNEISFEPNTNTSVSASYIITAPNKAYASETATSNIEGDIRGLYAESVKMVNPTDKQLGELGLSQPYATIYAVYPDTTIELLASKPDSDNFVYLMKKGDKVVYRISAENVVWTTVKYDDILSEYMINPNMTSLSKMTVNDGSNTYEYTLSSTVTNTANEDGEETTTTTTTVKCGGKEIELGRFTTYFQNISLITRADGETESFNGKPVFTVTYAYESGDSDTVSYYNTGGNRYLAVVNGDALGHVYKTNINKLVKQSADAAANKQVEAIM